MSGRAEFRVQRGEPDDVELAALVAVLAAAAAYAPVVIPLPGRTWGDPAGALGLPARPGATPWRAADAA